MRDSSGTVARLLRHCSPGNFWSVNKLKRPFIHDLKWNIWEMHSVSKLVWGSHFERCLCQKLLLTLLEKKREKLWLSLVWDICDHSHWQGTCWSSLTAFLPSNPRVFFCPAFPLFFLVCIRRCTTPHYHICGFGFLVTGTTWSHLRPTNGTAPLCGWLSKCASPRVEETQQNRDFFSGAMWN